MNALQEKLQSRKDQKAAEANEKSKLEKELADHKEENASMNNLSTKNSTDQMSPEAYLEVLSEEKDLNQMLHFCQLANAKYMQMMSQQYLEQLSKGGPNAAMNMPGMMPQAMGFPAGAGGIPQLQMYSPMQFQQLGQMPGMMPMGQAAFAPMMGQQPAGFQQE